MVPSTILRTAYWKQFYLKPMVPMKSLSLDSESVSFASLESLWPGIWQIYRHLKGAEKWSLTLTITKIEKLHIDTRRKNHWFTKFSSFRSTTKNNEVNFRDMPRYIASDADHQWPDLMALPTFFRHKYQSQEISLPNCLKKWYWKMWKTSKTSNNFSRAKFRYGEYALA